MKSVLKLATRKALNSILEFLGTLFDSILKLPKFIKTLTKTRKIGTKIWAPCCLRVDCELSLQVQMSSFLMSFSHDRIFDFFLYFNFRSL